LLELFQADPVAEWLEWAVMLQKRQDALFWDDTDGGWFSTTGTDPSVLIRMKEDYDGAEPTASSVAVLNLLTLSHLIEDEEGAWPQKIDKTLRLFAARLEQVGRAVPMMGAALSTSVAGPQQIVIVGEENGGPLSRLIGSRYAPFALTIRVSGEQQARLSARSPLLASMKQVDGKPAAFVCRNFTCRPPATTVEELERELSS
jgi:uncharacterized protein